MRYSKGLDTTGVSDLITSVRSRGNNESGLSYHLHHRETCAPASSEHVHSTTFRLLVEASLFRLTDLFHIHLFYLSKPDGTGLVTRTVTSTHYIPLREISVSIVNELLAVL